MSLAAGATGRRSVASIEQAGNWLGKLTVRMPKQERTAASVHGRQLLFGQIRKQWRGVVLGMLLGLFWTSGRMVIPKLVSRGIDNGIGKAVPGTDHFVGDSGSLRLGAITILIVGLLSAICAGARRWNAFREARLADAEVRDRLFAHLPGLHVC